VHISSAAKDFFGAEIGILHGSGREDIDVRMLVMEF
jgi:tRNA U54 and U55 pseudouridine synthase Pus10